MIKLLFYAIAAVVSYLCGSISFAVIISRWVTKRDVRDYGSGNAGTTNVMRTVGFWPGLLTFVLDFSKAAVSCLIGKYLIFGILAASSGVSYNPTYAILFCGLFCQIGHIYPLFFGFRGGKAVACTVGIFCVCNVKALLAFVVVFAIVFLCTRIISASSIVAVMSLPVAEYFTVAPVGRLAETVLTILIAIIVIWKHSENIERILKGEEKKLTIKRSKNK